VPKAYKLQIKNNDPLQEINEFFQALLSEKIVDALLLPQDTTSHKSVLPTLVKDPQQITTANPFVPFLLLNSASLLAKLSKGKAREKIGAVLRSCEIRAAVELIKLKQINPENLVIIGVDCLGTYEPSAFKELAQNFTDAAELTRAYLSDTIHAQPNQLNGKELRLACQTCEYPTPANADISINFFGCDTSREIIIQSAEKFDAVDWAKLGLVPAGDISPWKNASKTCLDTRLQARDKLFQEVAQQTKNVESFLKELENCRHCNNCRKECPICYCQECIFDSRIFEHDHDQYINWAERKGKIRIPTDTLLFHLTRMNHMAVSCVGCGQCTSACPHGVPVAKYFKTIGFKVQQIFDYQAGRSVAEEVPQSTFKEDEFPHVGEPDKKPH